MFVNKSFINKQSGTKQNVTSKLIGYWLLLLGCVCGLLAPALVGQATVVTNPTVTAAKQDGQGERLTYTQPFQNTTTTLSGEAVEANLYFIKMDYWDVKKLTINFNFQISQLANRATSDITLSLNGTKFYSFRPHNRDGLQSKTVTVPLRLVQGENQLKISGQILNKKGSQSYQLAQTPANWLTIYDGANANFEYELEPPTRAIKSFYAHFSGTDTIATENSVITVPKQASNAELTASMQALAGTARTITTETTQIPVTTFGSAATKQADYQVVLATYDHLPAEFKKQVNRDQLRQRAVLKTYQSGDRHYLIVTALTGKLLKRAGRYVANQELMQETAASTKAISEQTRTYTSELQYGGSAQLTTQDDYLAGANHRSSAYFVSLPVDRTNADGSKIRLHFRYAKNLDFKRSLVTVYLNNKPIGSKRLRAANAADDHLTVALPKGQALGHAFTIRVTFDLEMAHQRQSDNPQTPWALVQSDSRAEIKSQPVNSLLFSNYPSVFLKNATFNQLAIVRPKTLTADDYKTLTNLFNLMGTYAQQNTGQIQFYTKRPSQTVLKSANVIAFGTPKQNALIRDLNEHLYFQYNRKFTGFVSNEKLSIESQYGQNLGTAQLLRSPYHRQAGLLVVTGAHPADVYRASTQLNFQRNIAQYHGDAIVVDRDNNHYDYRFKKHAALDERVTTKTAVQKKSHLMIYLGLALLVVLIIMLAGFLVARKSGLMERKGRHDE
ncbi:cellulose biosynthesis cyclic di-GMP-binding regulatory protein BcsB [Lactiplantibacillus modestisalitolerans]|uniref:Cellulose biosynthesis cyclic di-GMP-binding regulatory protein BcsB n=1 Tax=Lactiplantibacillus modestisalitolerans TaxID=1457219 RepID=A0ABV5WQD4_9LACO|nr:cellulose biosynthesis cyclic di-GMP-binding regulatory protein BcsB [Lactiplantibacillus modestisalitolerans]